MTHKLLSLLTVTLLLFTATTQAQMSEEDFQQELAQREATLKEATQLPDAFWQFLQDHPKVYRENLLAYSPEVDPRWANNLNVLREYLTEHQLKTYPGLVLGFCIISNDEFSPEPSPSDYVPEEKDKYIALQAKLDEQGIAMEDFAMTMKYGKKDEKKAAQKLINSFNIKKYHPYPHGVSIGQFPHQHPISDPEIIRVLIERWEDKNVNTPGNMKWPMDNVTTDIWPIMGLLSRGNHSEHEYQRVWDIFNGKVEKFSHNKKRFPNYGPRNARHQRPTIKWRKNDDNPNTVMRKLEDGGLCGRLSEMVQGWNNILGRPALGMNQPRHRAVFCFTIKKDNSIGVRKYHSTHPLNSSWALWPWPQTSPDDILMNKSRRPRTKVFTHHALAAALSDGMEKWNRSRVATQLGYNESLSDEERIGLFNYAITLQPANLYAWNARFRFCVEHEDFPTLVGLLEQFDQIAESDGIDRSEILSIGTDFSDLDTNAEIAAQEDTKDHHIAKAKESTINYWFGKGYEAHIVAVKGQKETYDKLMQLASDTIDQRDDDNKLTDISESLQAPILLHQAKQLGLETYLKGITDTLGQTTISDQQINKIYRKLATAAQMADTKGIEEDDFVETIIQSTHPAHYLELRPERDDEKRWSASKLINKMVFTIGRTYDMNRGESRELVQESADQYVFTDEAKALAIQSTIASFPNTINYQNTHLDRQKWKNAKRGRDVADAIRGVTTAEDYLTVVEDVISKVDPDKVIGRRGTPRASFKVPFNSFLEEALKDHPAKLKQVHEHFLPTTETEATSAE